MVKGRLNYFKWKIEPTSKLCLPTKWTEISKNPIGFEFKLSLGPFKHHYVRIIEKTKDVTGATSSITVEGYLGVYHETGLRSMDKSRKKRKKRRSSKTKKSVRIRRELLVAAAIGAIVGSIYYYSQVKKIPDFKFLPSQQQTFRELTNKELLHVDEKTINKIFRKASLLHHPDKGGNPETFIKLSNLKEALLDQYKIFDREKIIKINNVFSNAILYAFSFPLSIEVIQNYAGVQTSGDVVVFRKRREFLKLIKRSSKNLKKFINNEKKK